MDKKNGDPEDRRDLIREIFPNNGTSTPIIAGGQQRVCTVRRSSGGDLRLPRGKSDGFPSDNEIHRVKWTLLTPAISPEINAHPGGWLPSWVDTQGKVQLLDGPGKNFAKRHRLTEKKPIRATLVSALVGKPVPVTGYALPNQYDRANGGPKSTHMAVPAGSVYYLPMRLRAVRHRPCHRPQLARHRRPHHYPQPPLHPHGRKRLRSRRMLPMAIPLRHPPRIGAPTSVGVSKIQKQQSPISKS